MKDKIPPKKTLWELIRENPRLHGDIGLWLIVIADAYETVLRNGCQDCDAGNFLLEENVIFDAFAVTLDYEDPETLRQRIRDALSKKNLQGQNGGQTRRKKTTRHDRTAAYK